LLKSLSFWSFWLFWPAMIPAMLGYVEESRGKTYADQARVVYNACQTCATEAAALGATNANIADALNEYLSGGDGASLTDATSKSVCAKVNNLIGEDITSTNPTMLVVMTPSSGDTISGHVYKVYYDSNGDAEGGYMVEVNIEAGTTNVQKDTKDGTAFTWPADAPVTP